MSKKDRTTIETEELAQEAAEAALHDEINRVSKEHTAAKEAAEAAQRMEKAQVAYQNRRKAKRERFKLFLHRLALYACIVVIATTWGMIGAIPVPGALLGIICSTGLAITEVRMYFAYRGCKR